MYDTVLIPTDGSRVANRAAAHGLAIARRYDATVHLLHVIDMSAVNWITVSEGYQIMQEGEAKKAMRPIVQVADEIGVKYHRAIERGIPATEILRYATKRNIDLITLGTHGWTGVDRFLLGSIAAKTARHAPCSVATVRREETEFSTETVDGLQYNDILLATDGSDGVEPAVTEALDFANRFDSTLHVLSVVPERAFLTHLPKRQTWSGVQTSLEERAREAIEAVRSRANKRGVPVIDAVERGTPHNVICEYAEDNDTDLITLGARGRSDMKHVLLGSVAERTVRSAHVPVLASRSIE